MEILFIIICLLSLYLTLKIIVLFPVASMISLLFYLCYRRQSNIQKV